MSQSAAPPVRSSFYVAMRILPTAQREAMFSVYRFCRSVDDVADDPERGSPADRTRELNGWRADVASLYAGGAPPRLVDLVEPVRRFGLKRKDFEAVLDGVEMDAAHSMRAPDWATLDLYCDRVASAVGRLSVRIFGLSERAGDDLAHHLGRALQFTNILRDVDEDAAMGRLYLPREALAAAAVTTDDPVAAAADPKLVRACEEVADRAKAHFEAAQPIMTASPRAAVRAPRLMAAAYRSLLDNMVAQGFAPPRGHVRPSRLRILGALLCYGIL